ncbi:MAG TPA: hypothetical protein VK711_05895, partial [Puia sp.]|nr:hypothetical protein [Puia sp.]
ISLPYSHTPILAFLPKLGTNYLQLFVSSFVLVRWLPGRPQSDEHPENNLKRAMLIMQSPAFSTRKNRTG